MTALLKTADLFSSGFTFSIGVNNKKKKTTFGGALSITVIIISLAYFIYLMVMYFSNEFLPKGSQSLYSSIGANYSIISQSIFKFKLMMKGMEYYEYEAFTGKRYLNFRATFEYYNATDFTIEEIPLTNCQETGFEDYLCMDLEKMTDQQKVIGIDPQNLVQQSYGLTFFKCIGSPDCATVTEIDDEMNNVNTYLALYSGIQQYNTTTRAIQNDYQLEYYTFDNLLVIESTYSLKKSYTDVKSGLVLQFSQFYEYFIEMTKTDRYHSELNSLQMYVQPCYAYFAYKVDQNYYKNIIQYPMITEILTQFTSIFNILLLVGIIANYVADSDILNDFNNLWLKQYFKLTALNLLQTGEPKQQQSSQKPTGKEKLKRSKRLVQLKDKINQEDFFSKSSISFLERMKIAFLGQSKQKQGLRNLNANIYSKMTEFTSSQIDILSVFKDLINIKMAIKLILTDDQYAALQFCGRNIPNFEIKKQKVIPISADLVEKQIKIFPENQNIIGNCDNSIISAPIISQDNVDQPQKQKSSNLEISERQDLAIYQNSTSQGLKERAKIVQDKKNEDDLPKEATNHLEELDEMDNNQEKLIENLERFLERIENQQDKLSIIDHNIQSALLFMSKKQPSSPDGLL